MRKDQTVRRVLLTIALCFAALSFVFWPVVVFRGYLRFAPHLFTTEWIKLSVSGVVVAILLRHYADIMARKTTAASRSEYVAAVFHRPLARLLLLATQLRSALQTTDPAAGALATQLLVAWASFTAVPLATRVAMAPQDGLRAALTVAFPATALDSAAMYLQLVVDPGSAQRIHACSDLQAALETLLSQLADISQG